VKPFYGEIIMHTGEGRIILKYFRGYKQPQFHLGVSLRPHILEFELAFQASDFSPIKYKI
jgi:hypothetical protein